MSFERNVINIPAHKAKSKRSRDVPITTKPKAILEMRRTDPAGRDFGPSDYMFGNAVGEKVGSIRTQWDAARLKANGYTPEWKGGRPSAQSRERLRAIGLHFHDLRRECGSRLFEAGVNLAAVRDWLGHHDVSTTDRYLATDGVRLQEAATAPILDSTGATRDCRQFLRTRSESSSVKTLNGLFRIVFLIFTQIVQFEPFKILREKVERKQLDSLGEIYESCRKTAPMAK